MKRLGAMTCLAILKCLLLEKVLNMNQILKPIATDILIKMVQFAGCIPNSRHSTRGWGQLSNREDNSNRKEHKSKNCTLWWSHQRNILSLQLSTPYEREKC